MGESADKEGGPFSNFIWTLVALELLIVPVLFAVEALDARGKVITLMIVGLTILVAVYTLRRADWSQERPIMWLALGGIAAQLIAGPFLRVAFDNEGFPRSLVPRLHEPLSVWVVVIGSLGAVAVGAVVLRFRDLIQARLGEIPAPYRSSVRRLGNSAAAWSMFEFGLALTLITGLHPPVWNAVRWILSPLIWAGFAGAALLYVPFAWKEWRDQNFKAFWKDFDLSQ